MKTFFLGLAILLTLSSCVSNRIYFTVDTQKQLTGEKIDLKQIQFFNSEEIVLVRQASEAEV
ncbi:MAG: hypothetical protein ACI9P8_000634, partial [Bacteroidia bacterium]